MREDDIRAAIENLSGDDFEDFARELVRRELYPGLNPTSRTHDLGEDARTEPTTVFMHGGLRVSLAISKTGTWTKLYKDCLRCNQTRRLINTLVFVTGGDPRTDTVEVWCGDVKQKFGWDLEVRALSWLTQAASRPDHESLVDDHLGVPPPHGDLIQNIEREFSLHADQALRHISVQIPGITASLPRDEIARVEDQLVGGKSVILSGDAGTGKSGIGASLAESATGNGNIVLLLDARLVGSIHNEAGLRHHLSLNGSVASAVARVGRHRGCRLIIDQLDNIAGSASAELLVELAVECSTLEGVEIVVISRKREGHEARLLEHLANAGFVELTSYPLSESKAAEVLAQLGISQPSPELVTLGQNLLNLELIGRIKQEQSDFNFATLTDEVDLWEQYMTVLVEREAIGSSARNAEQIIAEAVQLARAGLNSEDRTFGLDIALPHPHQRLISWEVILCEHGRIYRFRHEKLQDFLYAWDATQRGAMRAEVLSEINIHRSRNVFVWMDKIYARQSPGLHTRFLRETLLNA